MLVAPNALVSERFKHMLQSKACKITTHMVVEVCMSWCASLADDWKIKCAWPSNKCTGCPQCSRELFVVNASEAPLKTAVFEQNIDILITLHVHMSILHQQLRQPRQVNACI